MKNQNKSKNIKKLIWIASIVSFLAVAIAVFASWILYQKTVTLITENLRDRLLTISITQAANIDVADINALQTKNDWQNPAWARVVNKLHAAKYNNKDVVFMYIFRKNPDDPQKMEYVADADSINPFANTDNDPSGASISAASCPKCVDANRDGKIDDADTLQWPGQEYVDPPEETFQAYDGPLTNKDIYTDEYGSVLTGYAPIKDAEGNTVAVLGTDIKADDFFTVTRQTLYPFLIFIVFLILVILGMSVAVIYMWDKQAEILEEVSQQKSEFISLASHQLRGPLAAIKGYTSMILEGDMGAITQEVKDVIETIFKSTQALVVIVGDYLDISRIEQGTMKYDFVDFDLRKLAETVITEMRPNVKVEKVNLSFNVVEGMDYMIHADQGKIKQVISNLIDNAIKYTEQGKIEVFLKRDPRNISLSVKDNGVGIPPEVLPRLFEKFTRAPDASKTNIMGTGLGLYVARKMIEAHEGRIWAESPGRNMGSTFNIELEALNKGSSAMRLAATTPTQPQGNNVEEFAKEL